MRQNKQMEVAVVSVEQLHQEFEWMKEQLKKEIIIFRGLVKSTILQHR